MRENHRQVEVIIRIARIGGNRLLEQRATILAPPAHGYALVVHHLRQRQPCAHKRERILRLAIISRVEESQPTIEIRLQRVRIVPRQMPQSGRRLVVILIGEVPPPQS